MKEIREIKDWQLILLVWVIFYALMILFFSAAFSFILLEWYWLWEDMLGRGFMVILGWFCLSGARWAVKEDDE